MEQNKEPRNEPMHLQSIDFWQIPRAHNRGKVSSINGAGKTGYPCVEEWSWTLIKHHM
jgi:hypothetical protein